MVQPTNILLHIIEQTNSILNTRSKKRSGEIQTFFIRRKLFPFLEEIRRKIASNFLEFEDYFIVDSLPLEIFKFTYYNRIKICKKDFETAPSKGFCASQNNWFYGYKLHGVYFISGVFHSLDITKAEVHDVQFLKKIK